MTTHRLVVVYDRLSLPTEAEPRILMRYYPAGDVDTCPWPMTSPYSTFEKLRENLAIALYDQREMGYFKDGDVIELPDGSVFDFDQYVP